MYQFLIAASLFLVLIHPNSSKASPITQATVEVSLDTNQFRLENTCSAQLMDDVAIFSFKSGLNSERSFLIDFYDSVYRQLYSKLIETIETQARFEEIFSRPFAHWDLQGPIYRSSLKLPVGDFDYVSLCSDYKAKFQGADYKILYRLSLTDKSFGYSCEGKCFKRLSYRADARLMVRLLNGELLEGSTPVYLLNPLSTDEEANEQYCAGQEIPVCPGTWD